MDQQLYNPQLSSEEYSLALKMAFFDPVAGDDGEEEEEEDDDTSVLI